MSKKRTKEKKLRPNYSFLFYPKRVQLTSTDDLVKSHLDKGAKRETKEIKTKENALNTELGNNFISIKKDIIKSLCLTALILGLEIVLYFVWNKL